MKYKDAQKLFIKKAHECLRPQGHIYIDADCFGQPEDFFENPYEKTIFEGTDSYGNCGTYTISEGRYDKQTQMATFKRKTQLITEEGEKIVRESTGIKHIPTLQQIHEWLEEAGFRIVKEYGDYKGNPISEASRKAVIVAEKY